MKTPFLVALMLMAPASAQTRGGARGPAPSRELAQTALESARESVARSDAKAPRHGEAEAKLKEAEAHFQNARYDEAAQAADAAWKLIGERSTQTTKLTVTVDEQGGTTVKSESGQVSVEGGGVTEVLTDNDSVRVDKGQAPRRELASPAPLLPSDKQRMSVKTAKGGLTPVLITWQPVKGAAGYEVELWPAQGEPSARRVMAATGPELKVPLTVGAYRWVVRALARDARSPNSAERDFEVRETPAKGIRLNVKSSPWK
ncbi:LysM peptidoglycan-binding domain-containing protein [Melittangium boletus]|uniref:LysM peptidoglycan-binding domain-containing protein n=1 Tax=Melittangium boletus TaxID=83453 RepID=UPI003DA49785